MDINDKLNNILNNEKINKVDYDELKFVAKYTNCNEKIIRWFIMIQKYDINGWRDSNIVKSICETFLKNEKIKFYSLFCPSYLKGENLFGFRTDDIGFTSKNGIKMLSKIKKETEKIGFKCEKNEAIFFDLALEQPEKTIHLINDLEKNILNFKRYINNDTNFIRLSDKFKVLKDIIGYSGIEVTPLPVEQKIFGRVVERGKKFYKLFGWSDDKIVNRSKIICTSEALVGIFLKENMKNGIMIYTPTMLERLQIYNGKLGKDSLPIIVLKKEENDDK